MKEGNPGGPLLNLQENRNQHDRWPCHKKDGAFFRGLPESVNFFLTFLKSLDQRVNLYPTPRTEWKCLGDLGSRS